MQSGDVVDDRFELESLAGTGAMGEVWRARDRADGSIVAVKLLAKNEDGWEARFVREALSLAQLSHPRIVRYVAHGPLTDGFYLAMEWLEGEDLSRTLARGPLTICETIGLVRRVAEALAAAHAHGIVHRDIKPGNLFLPGGSLEAVKIVDFGVARIKDFTGTWTRNGSMLGTPAYMAPEQVRGERTIDARVDLFALGCVAFECATGRLAFGGGPVLAALQNILHGNAPRIADVVPETPPEFDALVRRMMAKDRAERPRDAAEVARALSGFDVPAEVPGQARRTRALTTSEQRIVTVLVVAGSEHVARTDALDALFRRTGAKLERLASDAFAIVLPPAGIPTDLAAQTARCALSLLRILPGQAMALATGPRESGDESGLSAADRAARLLRATLERRGPAAAAIVLDETTARLLDLRFDIRRCDGGLELAGERALETVHGFSDAVTASAATILGGPARCVGRDREIAAIKASLSQCAEDSVARAVLVTAPAGGGKSRLQRQLLDQLRRGGANLANQADGANGLRIWMARADLWTRGSPFGLISQLARGGEVPLPVSDAAPLSEQAQRGFVERVTTECARTPLLLVLEDLQWGDLPSIRLLDALLRDLRDAPLMVLAFARPDVHDLFPKLWGDREFQEIRLGTLTRSAGEKLAQETLGIDAGAGDIARIVEQAEGNPFYIEELARAAAEHREEIPETLLAMLQARLERLDAESRQVLRAASVFGMTFWKGGVMALLGGGKVAIDRSLRELLDAKIITRSEAYRFPGEDEFRFRDPLLRDAAYAMLTDPDRSLGHDLAGEWLERVGEPDEATITGHRSRASGRQSA